MISKTIVIDLETGGLDPKKNGICTVSAKVFNSNEAVKTWYIKPSDKYVYEDQALKVNNLSLESLEKKGIYLKNFLIDFAYYLNNIKEKYKVDKLYFLGHNLQFDIQFLKEAYNELHEFRNIFKNKTVSYHYKDSMITALFLRETGVLNPDSVRLESLYRYLNPDLPLKEMPFHTSYFDVLACEDVYNKMLNFVINK